MILVDTSVWIDHLRHSERHLHDLLQAKSVITHPFVIEELACGHFKDRSQIIDLLQALPTVPVATHIEVVNLISNKGLYGAGLGSVDVHLIASAMLAGASIWSKDKALVSEAQKLGLDNG